MISHKWLIAISMGLCLAIPGMSVILGVGVLPASMLVIAAGNALDERKGWDPV